MTAAANDTAGLERLARCSPQPRFARSGTAAAPSAPAGPDLQRPALSLERLQLDGAVARYRHKQARRTDGVAFNARDLLARLLMHVPVPRRHLVRYKGHYSSVSRARRREAEAVAEGADSVASSPEGENPPPAERRRLRRQWARLIRRIDEADPLLCGCGHEMRVISFLTDPPVVDKILRHLEQKGSTESERGPPGSPVELAS